MRLDELTEDESHVLGAMLRLMIRSDGDFSFEEEQAVRAIGERLGDGPRALSDLANASSEALPDATAVEQRLASVTRPDVRQLIREVLTEVSASDEVDPHEAKLMKWLDTQWAD